MRNLDDDQASETSSSLCLKNTLEIIIRIITKIKVVFDKTIYIFQIIFIEQLVLGPKVMTLIFWNSTSSRLSYLRPFLNFR